MRTLAMLLTLAVVPLALPVAQADLLVGEGQRYVAFRNSMNACNAPAADAALVGGACFDVNADLVGGKRLSIVVDDDYGENTYAYYEMTNAKGGLVGIAHFCGETLTQPVPSSVTKISVSIYPGTYVRNNCPGSLGTGVSGTIFVRAV